MRRTTPLTVTGLLGLALLAPTTVASAAGETCRGEAATIVGTGPTLSGTEGRDVIVTGRATEVRALGGDDLICVVPEQTSTNVLTVDAGTGDDTVDTTSPSLNFYYVDTNLGPGADTLDGGPAGDWVKTGDASGNTSEIDVVRTGDDDDIVTTSGGSDVVELGAGNNTLVLDGTSTTPQGRLVGGGYDTFVTTVSSPAQHAFDLAAGTYRTPGASADFSSFESLNVLARGAHVTIAGTEGDDPVIVRSDGAEPSAVVADLRGGDDDLLLDGSELRAGSRIDLGTGEDRLVAARATGSLALDLKKDELEVTDDSIPASGIEDTFLMARRVTIVGDAQDNTLISFACTSTITGGHGDDELIWDRDYVFESYSFRCPKTVTMRGGPGRDWFNGSPGDDRLFGDADRDRVRGQAGDDRIRGGKGADHLTAASGHDDVRGGAGADKLFGEEGRDIVVGEGGRDLANGGAGRDRCVAERERKCER